MENIMQQDTTALEIERMKSIVELWKIYPTLSTAKDKTAIKKQIASFKIDAEKVFSDRFADIELKVSRLSMKLGLQ